MKHFHKRFTRLTALALSAVLLTAAPLAVQADTVEEIEAKQSALAEKKAELESQIAELESDESTKEAEQALLAEKIDTVRTQISTATDSIDTLNDSITALEESLKNAEAEIEDTMELLKKRLSALYSAGSVSTLEILFNAESLHDFSMRTEMVSSITRRDKMLIEQVSDYMNETAAQREELEKEKTALADEKKLLESSQNELIDLEAENTALLEEIRAEKGEANEALVRTAEEEDALANMMANLIAQMQQQENSQSQPTPTPTPVPEVEPTPTPTPVPEAEPTPTPTPVPDTEYDENGNPLPTPTPTPVPEAKPTPTPTPVPTVKPTPTPTPVPSAPPSYDSSESFQWPLPGYGHSSITQYFGNNGHKGLDIGAPEGTPIVASRSGKVMVANNYDSWGDSWGYYVAIYHDSTYSTLYAHMSSVAAYEGQWVNKGDIIGYVGNTGNSFGNHLHFEVYQNGTRVDPSQFV